MNGFLRALKIFALLAILALVLALPAYWSFVVPPSGGSHSVSNPGSTLGTTNGVAANDERKPVLFWHFWGGADAAVVDQIVAGFNASQQEHLVRAIAVPGNNLDMKLFLAITGGDPPDVVNQDDPILADWAARGALLPLAEIADAAELQTVRSELYPAAVQLGSYRQRLFGLCNGLDIRALYYNREMLDRFGLKPPTTIAELDAAAAKIAPAASAFEAADLEQFGFLPNPKLLWSWGIVFGGSFADPQEQTVSPVTLDDPHVIRALEWMAGYGQRYGTGALSFRAQDQSLPGRTFPLLADRYAMVVDGQWRVRDIAQWCTNQPDSKRSAAEKKFGVCPLPSPPGGRPDAGWVNGNFFVVPAGANNPAGAWEFMKYWTGVVGDAQPAAAACAAGGWIPVTDKVAQHPDFQDFLDDVPLFRTFVELASSPHQVPRPNVVGAQRLDRELRAAAERAIYRSDAPPVAELLRQTDEVVDEYMRRQQDQHTQRIAGSRRESP